MNNVSQDSSSLGRRELNIWDEINKLKPPYQVAVETISYTKTQSNGENKEKRNQRQNLKPYYPSHHGTTNQTRQAREKENNRTTGPAGSSPPVDAMGKRRGRGSDFWMRWSGVGWVVVGGDSGGRHALKLSEPSQGVALPCALQTPEAHHELNTMLIPEALTLATNRCIAYSVVLPLAVLHHNAGGPIPRHSASTSPCVAPRDQLGHRWIIMTKDN